MSEIQEFQNEYFRITCILPWCKAVIDDAAKNTCVCFAHMREMKNQWKWFSQDKDWKIRFTNCGKGKIILIVLTKDKKMMDRGYYERNHEHLFSLIKKILEKTDQFHIKKGTLWEALYAHPTEDGHILELHRWVPKHVWEQHFSKYYNLE